MMNSRAGVSGNKLFTSLEQLIQLTSDLLSISARPTLKILDMVRPQSLERFPSSKLFPGKLKAYVFYSEVLRGRPDLK